MGEGNGPFAPREAAPGITGRNVCPAKINNHKHIENKPAPSKEFVENVKENTNFIASERDTRTLDPSLYEGVPQVTLPSGVHYNAHQKPLITEIKPYIQEETPPKQKQTCTFCRYHWCSVPHCPHTCIHQIDASDKEKPTCAGHWFIQLKPGVPSLCPSYSCRAESDEDQKRIYSSPTTWKSSCKLEDNSTRKRHHDSCWCNGWNSNIETKSDLNNLIDRIQKPRPPVIRNRKIQAILEREKREREFPPPPPDVCSYKPVIFELKPPTADETNWIAIPQPCVKQPKLEERNKPCQRENCLHNIPKATCVYDEPCKADCYDHPPGIKPHKYPLGYPNREEC